MTVSADIRTVAAEASERFARFIREEVNPGAVERDKTGASFGRDLLARSYELGLLSYAMPEELGGGGADPLRWGIMLEEVGYHCEDGSFPLVLSLYTAVATALYESGNDAIIEQFARPMAQGRLFGCFAYSDGADPFAFRSSARGRGDRWVLNSDKHLVTGGLMGDVFMTYVRGDHDDLMVFVVRRDDPGVSIEPIEVAGLRAAGLARLRLDGVEVDESRLLIGSDGISHAQRFLNQRRVFLVCGPLGRMRAVLEKVIRSLKTTIRYGRPLADLPNVQASLGRMYVAIETSRAITHRALAGMGEADAETMFDADTSVAKYYVIEQAISVALTALRLAGGYGYLKDQSYERYLRDFYGGVAGGGAQDILEVNMGAWASSVLGREQGDGGGP